jgi:GT2 family glycosyltransferase
MSISAVIPTYKRAQSLKSTLTRLLACVPPPDEILVHVDFGDIDSFAVLKEYSNVKVLTSNTQAGPGGGRNKLTAAASSDWIASFDDDSWPASIDFFARANSAIQRNQEVELIACRIIHQDDPNETFSPAPMYVSSFQGCGCLYRRAPFLDVGGYLPLRYAYGMEESDLALKLLNRRASLFYDPSLVVWHACDRETHHADPFLNGSMIANTLLLGFLRYPYILWPFAFASFVNRIFYSIRKGRTSGIVWGIMQAPLLCVKYFRLRSPVSFDTIFLSRKLRLGIPVNS